VKCVGFLYFTIKSITIKLWYDQDLSGRAAEISINRVAYDTIQKFPLELTESISTVFINDLRTGLRRGYSTAFRFAGQFGSNNDSLFIQIDSRSNGYIEGSFKGRNGDDKTDGTFRFKYK
jgi:hypothetical protein